MARTDPLFEQKFVDVVRLSADPSSGGGVSLDEQTGVPALGGLSETADGAWAGRDKTHEERRGGRLAKGLFTKNGAIVFTKDYEAGWFRGGSTYKQGTTGIITRTHMGLLGGVTHVDVRLKDGTFLREIPVEYFEV